MREFKKKTIALVLASVVTVAGAFGAERYKNSLMALDFECSSNGAVNMVVQTKNSYSGNVTPVKKDANTYVLMLPEINTFAPTPNLDKVQGYITQVSVKTLPYTTNGNGYTKITIKTNNNTNIIGKAQIYMPPVKQTNQIETSQNSLNTEETRFHEELENNQNKQTRVAIQTRPTANLERTNSSSQTNSSQETAKENNFQRQNQEFMPPPEPRRENLNNATTPNELTKEFIPPNQKDIKSNPISAYEIVLGALGFLLIFAVIVYLIYKAKNKLSEIAGNETIDVTENDNENENKKKNNIQNLRKNINKIDALYTKSVNHALNQYNKNTLNTANTVKKEEFKDIVDLDALFKKQTNSKTTTNPLSQEQNYTENADSNFTAEEEINLEDFFNEFNDENFNNEMQEKISEIDENSYQRIIQEDLKFSQEDIEKINQLLQVELDEEILKKRKEYLETISKPQINKNSQDRSKLLEEILLHYSIKQNVLFNSSDVEILKRLMNVEIDKSFLTDLRSKPKRLTQNDDNKKTKTKKPTELVAILKAKEYLPDLTEEIKKYHGRSIESNNKGQVFDYGINCVVPTISVQNDLPDLTSEISNKQNYAYDFETDNECNYIDLDYHEKSLKVSEDLPDLADALNHPEKYEEKNEEVIVDESSLLDRLNNVQFKPFYEEFPPIPSHENTHTAQEQTTNKNKIEQKNDDSILEEVVEKTPKNHARTSPLLEEFRRQRAENKKVNTKIENAQHYKTLQEQKTETINKTADLKDLKCFVNNKSYEVLSTTNLENNIGCHLAKNNDSYAVLGYVGDNICILKEYETLKSQKIQSRIYKKISDTVTQYLIRIGNKKFIINVKADFIEHVLDLC